MLRKRVYHGRDHMKEGGPMALHEARQGGMGMMRPVTAHVSAAR
jgi:hypothetical protein